MNQHVCATCGRGDVRLYRIYGNFLRAEEIRCNQHIDPALAGWGWWVPLVEDAEGNVWGYTTAPDTDIDRWLALPDAQPGGSTWNAGRWTQPRPDDSR